jgi:ATP-binding protein involved in chromosome partitioning
MQQITTALSRVRNARLATDVLSAEMVQDMATTVDGKVQFTLLLDSRDDAALVRDVRQAVVDVVGVTDVKVNVRDPRQQAPTPARPGRALPRRRLCRCRTSAAYSRSVQAKVALAKAL